MKNYIKSFRLLVFVCFLSFCYKLSAQCPESNFSVTSPVCAGSPLQFINNSIGASSYNWDFTPGYFSKPSVKLADTTLNLIFPGDITLANQNDTNIIFISGFGDGKLHRITYGNGPENPITLYENLGSLGVLYQPTDIALYKEDSTWFGLIVDYGSNYLFRVRFGTSLKNTPDSVVTLLTNVTSGFVNPWSIKITADSTGSIYALVCNHSGGSISILSFGSSIRNIPAATPPVIVPGTTYVQDGALVQSCGHWYAFLAGNNSSKIIKADFGNSLSNPPVLSTVLSGGGTPSDLVLIEDSSHWKLLYTDYNAYNIKKYDLGTDLGNCSPVYLGSDYFSGQYPKGICSYRKASTNYLYVLYGSNNVQTTSYTNSVQVNNPLSTDSIPVNIIFTQAGTYPVTLLINDQYGNHSTLTDSVVVSPAPISNFTTTDKCFEDFTSFIDSSVISSGAITSWDWDLGDSTNSSSQNIVHSYLATGSYNARLIVSSSFGCTDTIVKTVDITPRPQALFSTPAIICSETNMQFQDQSSIASGAIGNWNWKFGNGDSSLFQNPDFSIPSVPKWRRYPKMVLQ